MLRALWLLVLLFIVDRALGHLAQLLYARTRDGDTGETINALLEHPWDVVVFGGSRAESHYRPKLIGAALDEGVYNAGFKGSNIVYDYGLERLVLDHYVPKLIVYDFSAYSLLKTKTDPYDKLYPLYPYWRNRHVWALIRADGLRAQLPFLSHIYPFSSKIHSLLIFTLIHHRPDAENGYDGSNAVMADESLVPLNVDPADYDPKLVAYMHDLIEAGHRSGARMVVVESPRHAYGSFPIPSAVSAQLQTYGIPVIDFDLAQYPQFADHRLFRDGSHLNDTGAAEFSSLLGRQLRSLSGADPH